MMIENGFMAGLYRLSEWIMRLAYVNILWLLFIVVGGIIFGMGPATAGLFAVTRKMVMGADEISVFHIFWDTYRKDFKRSNIVFLIIVSMGVLLYMDHRFFQLQEGFIIYLLRYFILGLFLVYFLVLLFIFPLFVHYQMKIIHYFRSAVIFVIMQPLVTILMVLGCYVIYEMFLFLPGLIPFFGGSLFSYLLMRLAYMSFRKMEARKENQRQVVEEA
ncbi:YesL family protein [Gracilibacillus timonensis]|uniref:YesL family protein n=1 Tax=Gracilibacillus timonensis TaxID=1816696 RepID=UPI000825C751|nr:YesL family protein [Gracilibacillus timonensis]